MSITSVQVFSGRPRPRLPIDGIEFLDFLQPTIATFYMAVPSESTGAEYLCQIIKLHPLHEILRADLVLGGDAVHQSNHS